MNSYYHLLADGRLTRRFIISDTDYYAAFNILGVCAAQSGFTILSFSLEETHPHILGFGEMETCLRFKELYEITYFRHIVTSRGSADGVKFKIDIIEITNADHLKNVGTYIISQATKDGKDVMPYDYPWGTGSMYFRDGRHNSIWCFDSKGCYCEPFPIGRLSARSQALLLHTKRRVPQTWQISNGFLLPDNYIDVAHYEHIYRTHNCYRSFMSSGKNRDNEILNEIAKVRGVMLEDREAKSVCQKTSIDIFRTENILKLSGEQRLILAQKLRKNHNISIRQLSDLVKLPESELFTYVK